MGFKLVLRCFLIEDSLDKLASGPFLNAKFNLAMDVSMT
jgi:hypothetical protein